MVKLLPNSAALQDAGSATHDGDARHRAHSLGRTDCIYDVTDTVLYLNGIPDGIYLASIRTKCTRNMYWSLWSDSTSITVDNTLSVATPAPNVTLSPNPTGGTLTIRCAAEMTKVELYDMQGRLALSATPTGSETMLDLQPLPTGSYVAVITTSQGTATRKVERQ